MAADDQAAPGPTTGTQVEWEPSPGYKRLAAECERLRLGLKAVTADRDILRGERDMARDARDAARQEAAGLRQELAAIRERLGEIGAERNTFALALEDIRDNGHRHGHGWFQSRASAALEGAGTGGEDDGHG